jgi:predicted nucleotide-binding protein
MPQRRRSSSSPPPEPPALSPELLRNRIERLKGCIRELEEFDPQKVQKRYNITEVEIIQTSITDALAAAFGHNTHRFNLYKGAAELDQGPPPVLQIVPDFGGYGSHIDHDAQDAIDARKYLAEGKERSIKLLKQAIGILEHEITDRHSHTVPATRLVAANKVFVVHGHDEAVLQAVARFLEQLELEAIILREQPDQGRTIIEKFEDYAGQVGFTVVLLTPDDLAGPAIAPGTETRARQNVLFELGYFAGKLGRGRTCLLRKGDVQIPSDLYGVIYTDFDIGDGWKLKLVRELKAARLDFDANKMWS